MVAVAKKRLNKKNVNYQVQDATNLTYKDNVFDIVLIANALHIMPNPDKALKEIRRVLKEDGILIAPTFVYEEKINKARLYIMEKIGFKTFYKWTSEEYSAFIEAHGFSVKRKELIYGSLLPECILVCETVHK